MSEYVDNWKQRSRNHDNLVHRAYQRSNRERNRIIIQNQDPSCDICNENVYRNKRQEFERFWGWYKRMTREFSDEIENETENLGAHSYSGTTRKAFNRLIALEDGIVEHGLNENG